MGHGVELNDRLAYTGAHPWHLHDTQGRSIRIGDEPAASELAFQTALPWEPMLTPVYIDNGAEMGRVAGFHAVVRSDSFAPLGVVGDRYTLFPNRGLRELGEALVSQGARWHTVGSLHGGRRVFAALAAGERIELRDGRDAIDPFLMLTTAHDGSSKLTVKFTTVRPVCQNTVTMALAGRGDTFTARHTASIGDVSDVAKRASDVLGIATESFKRQAEVARLLVDVPMSRSDFNVFTAEVLTGLDGDEATKAWIDAEGRSKAMLRRKGDELLALFTGGLGNEGRTLWDGLNSVTEFIDHQRGRSEAFRAKQRSLGLDSALFGDGERKKQRAVELLLRRVTG
jgi:phage/plasmid-like protein (TIGR03299 family)